MSRTQKLLIGVVSFTLICAACWAYMLTHQFNTDNDVLRIIRERYGITTCKVVSKETIMRNGPSGELYHLLYNAPNGNSYPFTMEVNRSNGAYQTAYADDTIALALFSEAYDNYAEQYGVDSLTQVDGLWQVKINSEEESDEVYLDLTGLNQILLQIPATTNVDSVHIPVISDDPYLEGVVFGDVNWERTSGFTSITDSYTEAQSTYFYALGCAYGKEAPLSESILESLNFSTITWEYKGKSVTRDMPDGSCLLLTSIPDLFTDLGVEFEGDFHEFSWDYGGKTLYAGTDVKFGAYYDPLYTLQTWTEYTSQDLEDMKASNVEPDPSGGYMQVTTNPLTAETMWYDSPIIPASFVIVHFNPDIRAYDADGNEIEVLKNFILDRKEKDPQFYEVYLKDFYERTYENGNS